MITLTQNDFINQEGFNDDQKKQARLGFEIGFLNDLAIEEVKSYCKLGFDDDQMRRAMQYLENRSTIEKIAVYYISDFTPEQMEQARLGFQNGLAIDEVQSYYIPGFTWEQMQEKRLKLEEQNKSR